MANYEREQQFWEQKGQDRYVSLSTSDQQRVGSWIDWNGEGRALDIGGGSGLISTLLKRAPNSNVICVDISHRMLMHSPVPSVQANALQLPFPDNAFDLLVAAAFFHHLPNQGGHLFKECYRVLMPGGRLVGYDPNAQCLANRLFMTSGPLRLSLFSPDERPLDPQTLSGQALDAGFSDFECFTFSFRNPTLTPFELVQRYLLSPVSKGVFRKYLDRWFFWDVRK
jgi:ubiquinone/menaquinone biosynthesis C-methylase UbiE